MHVAEKSGCKRTSAVALGCFLASALVASASGGALAQDAGFSEAALRGTYKLCRTANAGDDPMVAAGKCVWQYFDGKGGQRLVFFTKSLTSEPDANGKTPTVLVDDPQSSTWRGSVSGTYRVFGFGGFVYESVSTSSSNERLNETELVDQVTIVDLDCAFYGMITRADWDGGSKVAVEYLLFGRDFAWSANRAAPTWRGTRLSAGEIFPTSPGPSVGLQAVPR